MKIIWKRDDSHGPCAFNNMRKSGMMRVSQIGMAKSRYRLGQVTIIHSEFTMSRVEEQAKYSNLCLKL